MSTQTLLHNILMLSYADRQFIAEQVMLSLETGKQTQFADNTQNYKELAAATTYTLDEAFQMVEDKLNRHYGTNLKIA